MRLVIPQPCIGASESALRMSRSSVPCRTSTVRIKSRFSCRSDREVSHFAVSLRKRNALRTLARVLTICALTVAALANAQTPPAFPAIRHVNLNGNGAVWVAFAGQLRERVESWRSFNFGALPPAPATVAASDVFVLSRALVSVDLHAGPHLRLFAQGKSSFSTTRDLAGGRRPSDVDEIDVHQLFAEMVTSPRGREGGAFSLRGGRLEMAYGHERLVSALDWANTKRSFDGVTARYGNQSGSVTAFWARPVVVRLYQADRRDSTTSLFGVYGTVQAAGI